MPVTIDWMMIGMIIIYMLIGAVSVPVKYVWDDITDSPFTITRKHIRGYLYTGAWLGFVTATLSTDMFDLSNLGICAIINLSAGPVLSLLVSTGTMMAGRLLKLPGMTYAQSNIKPAYHVQLDNLINNQNSTQATASTQFTGTKDTRS